MPRLVWPVHRLWFQFFSHKLMRLAAPFFLMLVFTSSVVLSASSSFFSVALAVQLLFCAGVVAGWLLSLINRRVRALGLAYAFLVMNAAALLGLVYFLSGKRDVWVRER